MIKLKFLNTTTSMPLDRELEQYFYEKFDEKTFENYKREGFLDGLSIFFVSKAQLDEELKKQEANLEEYFNPDMLGVYFPYQESVRNELIMISPEKIMEAAFEFQQYSPVYKLEEVYKTFLIKVILHELAHALMSANDRYFENMIKRDYKFILSRVEQKKSVEDFWFVQQDENHFHPSDYSNYSWYKIIEESLANGFVLLHNLDQTEKEIIYKFIERQPDGYKHASYWYECKDLLNTMLSWKNMKQSCWDSFCNDKQNNQIVHKGLDDLSDDIQSFGKCTETIDFIKSIKGQNNDCL